MSIQDKTHNYLLSFPVHRMAMIFLFYGVIHLLSATGILPPGFLPYNDTVYSLIGASLFSGFLAYHTRLIVSGKHSKYQLSEKDYVFGALVRKDHNELHFVHRQLVAHTHKIISLPNSCSCFTMILSISFCTC